MQTNKDLSILLQLQTVGGSSEILMRGPISTMWPIKTSRARHCRWEEGTEGAGAVMLIHLQMILLISLRRRDLCGTSCSSWSFFSSLDGQRFLSFPAWLTFSRLAISSWIFDLHFVQHDDDHGKPVFCNLKSCVHLSSRCCCLPPAPPF